MAWNLLVRKFVAAVGLGGAAVLLIPMLASAGTNNTGKVVPERTVIQRSSNHPCRFDPTQQCYAVITVHIPAHTVFPRPTLLSAMAHDAHACGDYSYVLPWVEYDAYSLGGVFLYWVRMDNEDWYDTCSAGNVYVNPRCGAFVGWSCDSRTYGSFWDGGLNANTDWDNQNTHVTSVAGSEYDCTWIRTWTDPYGNVTWNGWNGSGPC